MRIGVVGINHKLADLTLREKLAQVCHHRFSIEFSTHGDHFFILLSTCNRTEIYFSSDDLAETHSYLLGILRNDIEEEFDQKLYSYFGADCFLHLCRVVAGLDSAIIAETEIQGQVKNSYELALTLGKLPFELHYLFQKSLKVGKQVRAELQIKPGLPGIEHAIFYTGDHFFESIKKAKILFVGASEINRKVIAYLKTKECTAITLASRSPQRSYDFAQQFGIDTLNWEDSDRWLHYDWIIFGTKAPHYLLRREHVMENANDKKLIIDLSVPRNVDPDVSRDSRITLLNIDQINRNLNHRRRQIEENLSKAEQIVTSSTEQHIHLFQQKSQHKLALIG